MFRCCAAASWFGQMAFGSPDGSIRTFMSPLSGKAKKLIGLSGTAEGAFGGGFARLDRAMAGFAGVRGRRVMRHTFA